VEKGGLATTLTAAGVRAGQAIAHSDEMRLGLVGQVRRVWAPRGVKVRQRRQIVYQWRYLALAVDGGAATLRWRWLPNLKKETVAELAGSWHKDGVAALVWDGSGSHRAHVVRAAGPIQVRLPAYAPELNPAERIFEEIRGKFEGRLYATLDAKVAAVEQFLTELAADTARLRRLVAWDWISEALNHLPTENTALS
jgi:transposase